MRPSMPYALYPTLDRATKPVAFPSIERLAARIHRERRGGGIQLVDHIVGTAEVEAARMVGVYRMAEGDHPVGFIGWAHLAGGDRRTLAAALDAQQREPSPRAEPI